MGKAGGDATGGPTKNWMQNGRQKVIFEKLLARNQNPCGQRWRGYSAYCDPQGSGLRGQTLGGEGKDKKDWYKRVHFLG